ncbi:Methyltransferase type 12 [Sulfurimonas gotlandica GD1]|uniref:Methyltransferase type 12 n=1 Tax=Sulfurimonas gotlandica (strain DSM 19862 / JCM 16533 / GD1) TaxID=929558 RepID=B6BLN2_SULGG|nr:class I SAM-dependent methyltransferase [Sulfurimonas gotlandica]EDZ62000.1 methyltransferase type 12 [Sulfurimonas gotlandica GD1]EHP28690.1 Methyltransferase type 12 [Sulfurimonas gotlandica GD1]
MQDHFKEKSKEWDKGDVQVQGAKIIAEAINKKIELNNDMDILDFGVGTGLLGFDIARSVKKVYGVDTSLSMLEKLKAKNTPELSIETYSQDIIATPLNRTFDGLVSSMTLHHVEDLKSFFETIYKNINDNGFIAIADLESEDGTFHSDNTGVFHFGFQRDILCKIAVDAGFNEVNFQNINTINKPHRDFGVFLLTAKK